MFFLSFINGLRTSLGMPTPSVKKEWLHSFLSKRTHGQARGKLDCGLDRLCFVYDI
jgi:hypothetical protein